MRSLISLLLACTIFAQAAQDQMSQYRRGLYRTPRVPGVDLENSPRIQSLIRAGNLYLSLKDAVALAIENNLDVVFERLNAPIAETDILRAQGGGTLRGISTGVNEVPAGIGGPGAPLLTAAASGVSATTTLPSYSSDLAILTEQTANSSVFAATPFTTGPVIPQFDPTVTGQLLGQHTSTPETNLLITGSPNLVQRNVTGNLGYQQGFSPGTQLGVSFNNSWIHDNSNRNFYDPYTASNLGLTVTQPLLRGFGPKINRRFIRIAKNNQLVSDLVFKQQLISTVSGVIRLYQDLVALNDDVTNRRETLSLAQRLYEDNKNKVEVGTLAPVEVTRAQAQVAAAQQDLINAQGYVQQQELILKSVLTRHFSDDPSIRAAHIVPTDALEAPTTAEAPAEADLLKEASANRPDLLFAGIQIDNSRIYLEGSKNALKPEIDVVGTAQNNGLAGALNPLYSATSGSPGTANDVLLGGYGSVLGEIARRNYPSYSVGVNVNLPLRNRQAEADAIRDELQLRQSEVRRQQLINQVRLEVEDALVALNRSQAAYAAAVETRKLQEQSLEIEQERYNVGLSTTFLVLQYQSYLAQARTTEIASKSTYAKARTALDRAVGLTLDRNNVSVADAAAGRAKP